MSHSKSGAEGSGLVQDRKSHIRCRIPQRLVAGRQRTIGKSKFHNPDQVQINRLEVANTPRNLQSRPRSAEVARPKSAPRVKDEQASPRVWPAHPLQLARQARPDKERSAPMLKRPSNVPRRTHDSYKNGRQVIMVPPQRFENTVSSEKNLSCSPPDQDLGNFIQETISKYEAQEHNTYSTSDCKGEESDKVMQLRVRWQEKMVNFETTKQDLDDLQRALVEQYATLRTTHAELTELGQRVKLPAAEEMRIMNVSKMTPNPLYRLTSGAETKHDDKSSVSMTLPIDVKVLYNMPNSIISTCEQTLLSRQQMVCLFEEIMSQKMITKNALAKKVEHFKNESYLFKNALDGNRNELMQHINETVDVLKKSVSDAVSNQLRSEELVCKLSELSSVNEDLRKQLRTTETRVSNRARLEELEKELKDERCKKMLLRDRLSRAEGQLKIREDKEGQLQGAWEQAQAKTMTLERTVFQLREENKQLKFDYDQQLQKLTESIKENIHNLEEIAADREKLATEKGDLEKRLTDLSEHYKESLKNMKSENSLQITKLIEYEKKHNEVLDEKVKLESKVEVLCAQLIESELRYKDLSKQLSVAQGNLSDAAECRQEIESTRRKLDKASEELLTLQNLIIKKTETMNELENNFKKSVESEEMLKSDLNVKEEYISELELQRSLLEQRLQESDNKLGSYADELSDLKIQISRLLKDFGEFETLDELHKMVSQQREQLREATDQNGLLAQALKDKEELLEQHVETLTEQGHLLEQRETMLAMLSEKDEEQSNIIKLLRNNLEIRAQADIDLNQQIVEKNTEIESLISNVEARKEQISQLEKIILALEDQTRKSNIQKRKDKDAILLMEKKLAEYEAYFMSNTRHYDAPAENLDSLINMLENELGNPYVSESNNKVAENLISKQPSVESNKRDKHKYHEKNNSSIYQPPRENRPTKVVMGNYVKKTYITSEDQHKSDNLNRKKAITSMETQKWATQPDQEANRVPNLKDKQLPASFKGIPTRSPIRNAPYIFMPNHLVDEKKCKMFKLAGHKLNVNM